MQRRAAAVWAAFFLVIGAASYTLVATAQEPHVEFENPDFRVGANETFEVSDRTYTVTAIEAEVEGGGHGGGGSLTRSGELAWTNESARYTRTWENNSSVTLDDQPYRVLVPNESDPDSVTLREELNRTAILMEDPNADDALVTRDGGKFVVITENDTSRLVPADEYFPDPPARTFSEGETFDYRGNETTVSTISNTSVTLAWQAPRTNAVSVSDRANVTLNGETYLAFFPSNESLVLTQDFGTYRQQTASIDRFHEHKNGLWGVTALSWAAVVFVVGLAYLPSRY